MLTLGSDNTVSCLGRFVALLLGSHVGAAVAVASAPAAIEGARFTLDRRRRRRFFRRRSCATWWGPAAVLWDPAAVQGVPPVRVLSVSFRVTRALHDGFSRAHGVLQYGWRLL